MNSFLGGPVDEVLFSDQEEDWWWYGNILSDKKLGTQEVEFLSSAWIYTA